MPPCHLDYHAASSFFALETTGRRSPAFLFGRLALCARQAAHHLLDVHHIGEHRQHDAKRRIVLIVIEGCGAVGDEDHLVVHHHGIAGGRLAAHVGGCAGDDDRIDVTLLQDTVEFGRARNQRAEAILFHSNVARKHLESRPQRVTVATLRKRHIHGVAALLTGHMVEPVGPSLFCGRVDRVLDIDDEPAGSPHGGAYAVDIGDDLAGRRNFRRLTGRHESVLQVNHDVRGAGRIKILVDVERAAAKQDTVDGCLRYGDLVHVTLPFLAILHLCAFPVPRQDSLLALPSGS